jgi:hypothetical protein
MIKNNQKNQAVIIPFGDDLYTEGNTNQNYFSAF